VAKRRCARRSYYTTIIITASSSAAALSRRHDADLVEFQQDLAADLNVILLNVLQRNDDTFVEADVGEDLSGTSSDTRHRPTLR